MCVVSMVSDHFMDKWLPYQWVWPTPNIPAIQPGLPPPEPTPINGLQLPNLVVVPKDEYDKLKADVEEMKALLKRAKKYDEDSNQPHCEMEEKIAILRKVAEFVGVSLDDVFPKT